MGAQLAARGLAAGHGARTLFSDLDLVVAPGHVLGVVGPNGAGKSTLLRLLAGADAPSAGSVTCTPAQATVGLLPQEHDRWPGERVLDHLARRTGVLDAGRELDAATEALAAGAPGSEPRYSVALDRWLSLGGADLDERAGTALSRVGLAVGADHLMTELSGGQAARAGLAAVLLSRHDVLLLDEPTNDLDLAGLAMLEELVTGTDAAVALVSHDREFLSRTVTEVLELDLHQHRWHLHGGGYDAYLTERERRRSAARQRYEDHRETVQELTERARRQRSWAERGVRAQKRSSSDGDKLLRNRRIEATEQRAASARRTERLIERLEDVEEPRKEWDLRLSIAQAPPSGRVVATLTDAAVQRGGFAFGPATLELERGDRLAVTGPNGSGKSTLLALLLGDLRPDSGSAALGPSVRAGEIDQARRRFLDDATLLDAFCEAVPGMATSEVRTLLAKFGLRGDHVERAAASASPGERTRAALALLQAVGVNLLVLDEPTNHLDLPAIEQLEAALDVFDATVVLVSHDRRLLESFRATRRVELHDGIPVER